MALSAGDRLGPYEILEPLGAGGMGEVYRAKDTRLDRTVAIKVLRDDLAADPHLKARFEREARAISALAHPNICTLYDVGEEDGQTFLVMEHLEGQTLAERLKRRPLPLDKALEVAAQIADALSAAHKQGIVHRDLKPANVMLTKTGARLLDFGLAGLTAHGEQPAIKSLTSAPTEPQPLTEVGTIMGTLPYMAPEQIEGKPADARTDLWALGAIIYKMIAGQRAFDGSSPASLLGAILEREPVPLTDRQPLTPPSLERLVRRCLAKDRDGRWDTAHDVADELRWIAEAAPEARVRGIPRWMVPALVAAVIGAAVASGLAAWSLMRPPLSLPAPLKQVVIPLPPTAPLEVETWRPAVALSPDGTRLVYVANRGGKRQLYLREMDRLDATPIPGTEGGHTPFFSPDGQSVGFVVGSKLRKVAVSGGAPQTLATVPPVTRGASWGSDDTIIFTTDTNGGLYVRAAGNTPPPDAFSDAPSIPSLGHVTTPEPTKGEYSHRWPHFLPGGKAVLFTIDTGGSFDEARIAVLSLETGQVDVLLDGGTNPRYSPTGHIVFSRAGALLAVPFDLEQLERTGDPVTVVEDVLVEPGGAAHFTFSADGSLAYVPGGMLVPNRKLVWVNRQGGVDPLLAEPREYMNPSLSPDGRHVAVIIREGSNYDVWVSEVARGSLTRLTSHPQEDVAPIWTPDGKQVTFASEMSGNFPTLWWRLADGSGPQELLLEREEGKARAPTSWSPDGQTLAFTQLLDPVSGLDIWMLPLEGEGNPWAFLDTEFDESAATFSPDGRLLAYMSNETGHDEVYVQPFSVTGPRWKRQVSIGGGTEPVWAPDSRDLFYRNGDKMMAVTIETEPQLSVGTVRPLFEGRFLVGPTWLPRSYDISPDGQHFLMIKREQDLVPTELIVVFNWFEELKAKMGEAGK